MNLFERQLLSEIVPFIERKEAIMVKGMRRVGKTSLLLLLKDFLIKEKKVLAEDIYFFDLEELEIREDLNKNPRNLLKYLREGEKRYVFLDEIQYLENPSNFIKIIVDHFVDIKIFATGSSSLEIKKKIQDSLIGRVVYFQLFPLNFFEFLDFKKLHFPSDTTTNQKKQLDELLNEYLTYGGMPAIVLENNPDLKKKLLKNYVNLYITKDIRSLADIENISAFNGLSKLLAGQVGSLLNKDETSNTLGINTKTVGRYLDILNFTYIIFLLKPFYSNLRSKLTKRNKIFFYDLGFRNSILNDFNEVDFRVDNGGLFENFVFLSLLSKFDFEDVSFYRNTKKNEIDFIVEAEKLSVEVKFKRYKYRKIFRVFDKFSEFHNFVVNKNFNQKTEKYEFIDWWSFLNFIKK